jgi:hypothetical protein
MALVTDTGVAPAATVFCQIAASSPATKWKEDNKNEPQKAFIYS